MLRGLTTVNFVADDVTAAAQWYAKVLGVEPYFERKVDGVPAYIEFRVGDYQHELGIIGRRFAGPADGGGSSHAGVVYWHVDDLDACLERLVSLGATLRQPPVEYGPGFVAASVTDPFGNLLGVMYNRHYLDMLAARRA